MWFLECEGDLFENKAVWLRPGTKLVIGRTSKPEPGQRMRYIENSSVSRKHLTVDIANIEPGESRHLHQKTKLQITDNSKVGSWINSERLEKGTTRELDRNDNAIKLGNYEHRFHIKWKPTVFSFSSLPRALRQLEDPLADHRRILEPLGIKCIVDYIAQFTTHLFAKKRNTPDTLQAFVNARYVVTDDYLNNFQHMSLDALEQDFKANWPSEEPYSPPPGNEPRPRKDKSPDFLPNPLRSEVFSQYIFVFIDPGQHTNLMPTITGGGGKALCHPVNNQNPDPQDLLTYVREVAGKKSDRNFNLGQQPKTKGGIILIRPRGFTEERPRFFDQVDSSLGQSSIEQGELLEVILDADASKLKRPAAVVQLEEDTNMSNSLQQSPAHQPSESSSARRQSLRVATEAPSATPENDAPETSQQDVATGKRRGRRPLTQTKFKGFDEIDINALPKYRSPSPSQQPSPEPSQALSPDFMDEDEHSASSYPAPSQHTQRSTRKRPPPDDEETHHDMMADMLQGAAKMKKRRIDAGIEASTTPSATQTEESTPAPAVKKVKKRKDKEVDVRAILAERQQEQEERRREDEEKLRNQLEGMEVADMQNLAQIEVMEIRREPPPRSRYDAEAGHDDRWDNRWNGRKNFKKFRKQGTATNTQTRARVFVSLEEVDPKAFGAQDDYFLEPRSKKSQTKAKRSQQTQDSMDVEVTATPSSVTANGTPSQRQQNNTNSISLVSDSEQDKSSDDEDNTARFRRRIATSRLEDAEASRAEAILPEEIAGTARDQDIADAARQAKSSASVRTQPGKRTARGVVDEISQPRKRVQRKPSPDEVSEDEDEDDEESSTRFRRRKR
ncbi:hypothetical protein E4T50_06868 [Aureobasidium sp. EXF-12298]|nr:hypothetical protein E4T50_06868 [Aureobasidium sp. EXF-12298]KAI4750125.1 hypothetical protein E4T51_16524 [Aureobasidium sp. EXF-12344]KAI4767574.1 hypothetical protein E4T52_17273 [Aureobasidium sp. EXF-3400]